jgi:hypothetical protein
MTDDELNELYAFANGEREGFALLHLATTSTVLRPKKK